MASGRIAKSKSRSEFCIAITNRSSSEFAGELGSRIQEVVRSFRRASRNPSRVTCSGWRSSVANALSAQVEIRLQRGKGDSGELAIRFSSLDELGGLLEKLGVREG